MSKVDFCGSVKVFCHRVVGDNIYVTGPDGFIGRGMLGGIRRARHGVKSGSLYELVTYRPHEPDLVNASGQGYFAGARVY